MHVELGTKKLFMEVLQKPELIVLEKGKSFKTLYVRGQAGMEIALHHSTKEVVIIVQEGEAFLKLPDALNLLVPSGSFIIPAGVEHSIEILKDFKAFAIMGIDSEIEFEQAD